MSVISQNLQVVRDNISQCAQKTGRSAQDVQLLAVTKTWGVQEVLAAARAGQRAFGENYEQEAIAKIEALKAQAEFEMEWHFIGPIQSNKTRSIAQNFDWVHTIDRLRIAQRLSDQRPASLPPLNICLQINISHEENKSGVLPVDAMALAKDVMALPNIKLRGLMAIPKEEIDPNTQREAFHAMRNLYDEMRSHGIEMDTLSMGMSGDMEAAIAEGASIVRVGSAIFGYRE